MPTTVAMPHSQLRGGRQKGLKKLISDGLYPVEILTPIAMIEASDWDVHVKEQWGIYAGEMPDQDEFMKRMNDGNVVYGPFGGY